MKRLLVLCAAALALTACGAAPKAPSGVKVGKPYTIDGQTYYPEYDPHYDRSGMASWYGPGFHGKSTANGERFNKHDLTAAHPTLPMPSLVRVTNLENGISAIVRINDRGPFKDNRLIDLSKASAETLGVVQTGLARVRVQYLKEETEQYWADKGLTTGQIQFAKNDPYAPDLKAGKRGGLDGVVIDRDDSATQIADAAPMMAVTTAELEPSDIKVAPQLPPRRGFISEANAEEGNGYDPPAATDDYAIEKDDSTVSANDVRLATQPKVVHLYGKEGRRVTVTKPRNGPAQEQLIADNASSESIRAVAPLKPAAVQGKWYVQAGSFSSEQNAQKLVSRLGSSAQASVALVEVSGKTWHRVRLGPFMSRDVAEEELERASSMGAAGAHVIKE